MGPTDPLPRLMRIQGASTGDGCEQHRRDEPNTVHGGPTGHAVVVRVGRRPRCARKGNVEETAHMQALSSHRVDVHLQRRGLQEGCKRVRQRRSFGGPLGVVVAVGHQGLCGVARPRDARSSPA